MEYFVHIGGERLRVTVENGHCEVDGEPVEVELAPANGTPVRSARVAGRSLRVRPRRNGMGDWSLSVEGAEWRAQVLDPGQEVIRQARVSAGAEDGLAPLVAPMPGMVVRVEVAAGDEVEPGQGLVIVEAMKMENELKAGFAARVTAVHAHAGSPVDKDQVLVEFEPIEGPGEGAPAANAPDAAAPGAGPSPGGEG
jgi:biotin carboxyl carrier protein